MSHPSRNERRNLFNKVIISSSSGIWQGALSIQPARKSPFSHAVLRTYLYIPNLRRMLRGFLQFLEISHLRSTSTWYVFSSPYPSMRFFLSSVCCLWVMGTPFPTVPIIPAIRDLTLVSPLPDKTTVTLASSFRLKSQATWDVMLCKCYRFPVMSIFQLVHFGFTGAMLMFDK